MSIFSTVGDKVAAGADWVKKTGEAAVDTSVAAGKATYNAGKEAAGYVKDKAVAGAEWVKDKAVAGAEWVKDKAVAGAKWVKKKAVAIGNLLIRVAKRTWNKIVGEIAKGVADAATRSKTVEKCLQGALEKHDPSALSPDELAKAKKADGQYMGSECPGSSPTPPKSGEGRLPNGCKPGAKLPKIIYTNGINTSPEQACATMSKMADSRCAEVVGVYNASFGIARDLLDCKDNIDGAGREKSAHSQAALIKAMLTKNPPEPVTIYAHSQGGLITQESLKEASVSMERDEVSTLKKQGMSQKEAQQEARKRTRAKMSNVTVYSFGTAETGWPPVGANFHQMTNTADPVPKVIHKVQENRGTNTQPDKLKSRHRFEKTAWDPIAPHSMDDAYLPEKNRVDPVPKNADGGCC